MIGLMLFGSIALYWWLASTVINKVYTRTQSLTKKRIAIAIFILIPTWDIILGFPIYAYLCTTQSGAKIYKTVDNVEGFYIGEQSKDYEPQVPYKGYRYIDYKEQESGKYYRSYRLDTNISDLCVPVGIHRFSPYAEAFSRGKCIAKEEIKENEVSRWEYDTNKNTEKIIVPIIKIKETVIAIRDRKQDKNIAENRSYRMDQNWVIGFGNENISSRGVFAYCGGDKDMLEKTLKNKLEGR